MNGCGPGGRGSPGCSAEQAFCGGSKPSGLTRSSLRQLGGADRHRLGLPSDEVNGPPQAEQATRRRSPLRVIARNASVTDDGQQTLAEDEVRERRLTKHALAQRAWMRQRDDGPVV